MTSTAQRCVVSELFKIAKIGDSKSPYFIGSTFTMKRIRLGTRASALARWQADWTAASLRELDVDVEIVFITTEGDSHKGTLHTPNQQGWFTKRIQQSLLDGEIDLAVHSLKDLPTEQIPGLQLSAVPKRENPADALISKGNIPFDQLPDDALIGTGSLRRQAQLLNRRPGFRLEEIRGNVDTRLSKLKDGEFDAIMLAFAGLKRLGLESEITETMSVEWMIPAVGQAALGLETRTDDAETIDALSPLIDAETFAAVTAERSLLKDLRGGCLAPVGGYATCDDQAQIELRGVVLSPDGKSRIEVTKSGPMEKAVEIGSSAAEELISMGASELIAQGRPE